MLQIDLHLTAFHRKERMRLVAQEMVIRFLEPVLRFRETSDDTAAVQAVLAAAHGEARMGVTLRLDSELDAHLQATVDKADAAWRGWSKLATKRLQRELDQGLSKFRSAAAALRCADCVHDDLCRGILLTELPRKDIVSPCLHTIDQMAREASDFTREIYRRHVPELVQQHIDVDLYISPLGDHASRVTGTTAFARSNDRFDLDGVARRVWIQIGLPLAALDAPQYFSVLYVMAHELAVHGVQQLLRAETPDPPDRVAFAEGLIDRVVYKELVETLKAGKMSRLALPMRAIGDIDDFHTSRKDEQEEVKSLWRADLRSGHNAYEFLVRVGKFLARNSRARTKDRPEDWAHATALSLNLMATSGPDRQRIASALGSLAELFARPADDDNGWPEAPADWQGPLGKLILSLVDVHDYPGTDPGNLLRALENTPGALE
jgi:hypothetical protein